MDEILNIELNGIQQEMSLDILLNEFSRFNSIIKSNNGEIIQESIDISKIKNAISKFFKWLFNKIIDFFKKIKNIVIKFYNEKVLVYLTKLSNIIKDKKNKTNIDESYEYIEEAFKKPPINVFNPAVNYFNTYYNGPNIDFGIFVPGLIANLGNIFQDPFEMYEGVTDKLLNDSAKVTNVLNKNSLEPEKDAARNYTNEIEEEREGLKPRTIRMLTGYSNTSGSLVSVIKGYFTEDIYNGNTTSIGKFLFTNKMMSGSTSIQTRAIRINNSNIYANFNEIYNVSTNVDIMINTIENAKTTMKQYLDRSEKQIKNIIDPRFYQPDGYILPALQSYISTCVSLSTQLVDAVTEIGVYWTNNSIRIIENVIKEFQRQII